MNFQNSTLEKIIRRFKWTRENTIQIYEQVEKSDIFLKNPFEKSNNQFTFQPVIYQFQCIVTTTDTYYRKLVKDKNEQFGILVFEDQVIPKKEITQVQIKKALKDQAYALEELLRLYDAKKMDDDIRQILTISDHEYLHQGELILMLRFLNVDLPERYRKAWAL